MGLFNKVNIKFPKKINFDLLKKINLKKFKKNEFIIYAIALMLVTAGYFNYTSNLEDNVTETYAEEDGYANVGDARLVDSNDVVENSTSQDNSATASNSDEKEAEKETEEVAKVESQNEEQVVEENLESKENEKKEDKAESNKEEDTKEVNQDNVENDYFVSSKLDRDKNYASMISTYTNIVEDSNVSQTEKAIAMKEITKINDTKNAISISENLITTKGFSDCIILVNNDSVNVVVKVDEKLTSAKVAQIQNIVSREFECKIENIHITEK